MSRSGYYEWSKRSEKIPAENSESSVNQIQEIAFEFPYFMDTGGSQQNFKIVAMRSINKRVLRLKRWENLLCHKKKFKPVTTDSTHGLPVYPNLLKGMEITGLNQAWAFDITYVQL